MIYRGRIENGKLVLEGEVTLPEGTEVRVEPVAEFPFRSLAEEFSTIIGVVTDLPSDMAERHDHYLHGAEQT